MSSTDDLIDEISAKIKRMTGQYAPAVMYGVFVAAEDDPLLSYITIDNRPYRNVTKAASVTGLVAGNTCIVIAGGSVPLTIIGYL
jgi:hypothetical protein